LLDRGRRLDAAAGARFFLLSSAKNGRSISLKLYIKK
jgi:hypothetical protein